MVDPDLQIREGLVTLTPRRGGGGLKQKNISALRASVWSKNNGRGGGPLGPSPGSATGNSQHFVSPPRAEIPY